MLDAPDAPLVPQRLPDDAVQLLRPNGELTDTTTGPLARYAPYLERLDATALQKMYRIMATTRRVDQEATSLQRQGQLVLWVPSTGQEAAQAGALAALEDRDWIFPTYREHVLALGRGVSPRELMVLFRGVAHSGWDPADYNMHVYTLVLAAENLHATGYAWGINLDQHGWDTERLTEEGQVVLACFGDGASSEGDVHESMVFAASYNAPVVFFCQNNHWAISVPFEVQSRVPIAERAAGYGFEGITYDGNDPLASFAVAAWAADQARHGNGPVLIEAHTYRMGAHTTADDPTKYRTREEEEAWNALDPLTRLREHLIRQDLADDAFFDDVANAGEQAAAELRTEVLAMTGDNIPPLDAMFENTYGTPHPLIAEEQAWHQQWQAGFQDAEGQH